jgi:Putative beta-barrel porin-2, OmpL-like. bbp2
MKIPVLLASAACCLVPAFAAAQSADTSGSPVKISGYVTSSLFHASNPTDGRIVGRLYDRFHDQFTINAARLSIARAVATDKTDAGFQIDAVFGQNATVLQSAGLSLGNQGDIPQAFVTLNVPTGKDTWVQFKAGKMWTLLDVEVIDDILNPNFSHGYAFVYLTNFTNTGVGVDAKLSGKVDAQFRLINGWDVVEDNNTGKSFMARLGITPSDKVGLAFLGYYGPEQAGNTSNKRYGGEFVGTFKPSATATLYAQYDVGGEQGLGTGTADASWRGAGVWGVFDLTPKVALALRGDYIDDGDGVRTSGALGFAAAPSRSLSSLTATANIKAWPHALLRPEIRFEHSSRDDFGTAGSLSGTQVSVGFALSYIF